MKNLVPVRLISVLALTVALAFMLAAPAAVFAAEAEDVWNTVSIEMYDLAPGKEPTLVMSALAREDVDLPMEAAIAIPKGSSVLWLGEVIDGMDPNSWPAIEGADLDEGDEYDVVSFTLVESRRAQLELAVPEGFVTEQGGLRVIDLEWISAGDVVRARVGISTPHEYHLEGIDPEPVVGVRQSDIFYSIETSPVAVGSVLHISGTMGPGEAPEFVELRDKQAAALEAQAASEAAEASAVADEPIEIDIDTGFSVPPIAILIGLLVAAIGVTAFFIYRNMQAAPAEELAEDEDVEDDDVAEEPNSDDADSDDADESADDSADADWGDVDVGDE